MTPDDRPGEKLTRKQEEVIAALLLHSTLAKAAEAVGVAEKTLWRWLQVSTFQETYRLARREAVNQAIARLQKAASTAVDTLETVMADPSAKAPARVAAARSILEFSLHAVELDDLQARIARLEKGTNT